MMSIGSTTTSVPETTRSPAPLQPQQQQQAPGSSPLPPTAQTQPQQPQFPPGVKLDTQRPPSVLQQQPPQPPQQQQTTQRNGVPSLLSDLVVPFENVKQKGEHDSSDLVFHGKICSAMLISACTRAAAGIAAHRMANLDQVHKLLDGGYSNMPQPQDTEK
jgi:CCR4-NOT transcription complex subunit 3